MKKHLLGLIVLCCVSFATFAQEKGDFEVAGDIGMDVATVTVPNYNSYNSYNNTQDGGYRVRFNGGVSGEYYFSEGWGIKVKVNYDEKGWSNGYITDQNQNTYNTHYKLNYITIPLMANWHFGRTRNWYLNFGPYIGFLTSASETTFGTDVKSAFNSTDAGLAFGIGVKIPVSENVKFLAEYQGEAGLATIFQSFTQNPTTLNSSYGLNVGLAFTLSNSSGSHRDY